MKVSDVKKAADKKFVEQFFDVKEFYSDKKELRSNPFFGGAIEVDKGVAMLIDFIFDVESKMQNPIALKAINEKLTPRNVVSKFDRARYLVLALDSKAYSAILD